MTSADAVCAYRLGVVAGRRVKRLSVRTPDYSSMCRWLARTRVARLRRAHTLWIEEAWRPATDLRRHG